MRRLLTGSVIAALAFTTSGSTPPSLEHTVQRVKTKDARDTAYIVTHPTGAQRLIYDAGADGVCDQAGPLQPETRELRLGPCTPYDDEALASVYKPPLNARLR